MNDGRCLGEGAVSRPVRWFDHIVIMYLDTGCTVQGRVKLHLILITKEI